MQVMSKMSNYYEVLPQNFNDDLADSLMKAFDGLESVDVKDEIPRLQHELWQRGYLIAPRPDKLVEHKELWFVKVTLLDPCVDDFKEDSLYNKIREFDRVILENDAEFIKSVKAIVDVRYNLKIEFVHNDDSSINHIIITIEDFLRVVLFKAK